VQAINHAALPVEQKIQTRCASPPRPRMKLNAEIGECHP